MSKQKDYWTKDGAFFVCDGWKYGIAPDGRTVCVGQVEKVAVKPPNQRESP